MATAKTNVPKEIGAAIRAAAKVGTAQAEHHRALLDIMTAASRMNADDVFPYLTLYTSTQHETTGEDKTIDGKITRVYSLCTNATFKWLEVHFGIRVNKGIASRGREWTAKGINEQTYARAKVYPWFALANDAAFKMPSETSFSSAASTEAKRERLGEPPLTDAEVLAMWRADIQKARASAKVSDFMATYNAKVASGDIKVYEPKRLEVAAPSADALAKAETIKALRDKIAENEKALREANAAKLEAAESAAKALASQTQSLDGVTPNAAQVAAGVEAAATRTIFEVA
jgi:hypothetical protein